MAKDEDKKKKVPALKLEEKGLDAFSLKLLAAFCMLLDHIGYIWALPLGTTSLFFRLLGRFAFPIFAFLLTEGFVHTSSRPKYVIRLLVAAAISMVPYYLVFGTVYNVLFTLAAGLMVLMAQDAFQRRFLGTDPRISKALFAVIAVLLGMLMQNFDWGLPGIVAIYVTGQIKWTSYSTQGMVCCGTLLLVTVVYGIFTGVTFSATYIFFLCGIAIAAIWICMYNGRRGQDMKYWFYAFYPVHLLILYMFTMI